ncbi:MAG: lysophospholipid acyltransferase family protein [Neisseriaceae bacterium]|nr:lysophospholipid acyltransferase family protein [Neisseriaceae bacterium]
MRASLAYGLIWCFARLPLRVLQGLGALGGRIAYAVSPRFKRQIFTNLQKTPFYSNQADLESLAKQAAQETGKGLLEMCIAWSRSNTHIANLVLICEGWPQVEGALAQGQGLLFITPHLGNFDIAGRYVSQRLPCPTTAMFKPPKLAFLEPIMQRGRIRGKGHTAPATAAGVRLIMKALMRAQATVILPDQVPSDKGEGVWVNFYGEPAYTMTLVSRLAQMKKVSPFLFFAERLPRGLGFKVHILPLNYTPTGHAVADALQLNQEIEGLIAKAPAQYLWAYNRYKCPKGIQKPEA